MTKTAKDTKGTAKPTAKTVVTKAGGKVVTGKKKKAVPEAESEAKPSQEVTIEVTLPEDSEDKKVEEKPAEVFDAESPPSSSVDATPLVDPMFTPSTANRVEQIITAQTSLSKELAEKLPRLSEALAASADGEEDKAKGEEVQPPPEGTSVDKLNGEETEKAEDTREVEKEQPLIDVGAEEEEAQSKEVEGERAERRKVC